MSKLNIGTNVHLIRKFHKKDENDVHKVAEYYVYKDTWCVTITSYKTGITHGAYQLEEIREVSKEEYPEYFL